VSSADRVYTGLAAAAPFLVSLLTTAAIGPGVKAVLLNKASDFYGVEVAKVPAPPRTLTASAICAYLEWIIDCFQASTVVLLPIIGLAFALESSALSSALPWIYAIGSIGGAAFFLRILAVKDPFQYVKDKHFKDLYTQVDLMALGVNGLGALIAGLVGAKVI